MTAVRSSECNGKPSSAATHRADRVFPTPGGPTKTAELAARSPCWASSVARRRSSRSRRSCVSSSAVKTGGSRSRCSGKVVRSTAKEPSPAATADAPGTKRSGLARNGRSFKEAARSFDSTGSSERYRRASRLTYRRESASAPAAASLDKWTNSSRMPLSSPTELRLPCNPGVQANTCVD